MTSWTYTLLRRALFVAILAGGGTAVLALASSVAEGQEVRSAAAARALFREGVACADRHEWDCAADRFRRAYALRPSPIIAYNLGAAYLALGRLVEGSELLVQVSRDEEAPAQVRQDARQAAEAAAPRLAQLTVRVRGSLSGVALLIDGQSLPRSLLDTAHPVDPGEHVIEARRGTEIVATGRATLGEGEVQEITIRVPDPPPEEEVAIASSAIDSLDAPTGEAPPSSNDEAIWIGLGVGGGVALVAGAIAIGVVLGSAPQEELATFRGTLGDPVEIGR